MNDFSKNGQSGQGMVEYALMLCLIGVVIMVLYALGLPLWACVLVVMLGFVVTILVGLGLVWLTEKFPLWPEYVLILTLVCILTLTLWSLLGPTIINLISPR